MPSASLNALKLIQFVGALSVFYEFTADNASRIGRLKFTLVDQTIGRFVRLLHVV